MRFYPPRPNLPDMKEIKVSEEKELKKNAACKKYVLPTLEREKKQRRINRSAWFWEKGLPLLNFLLALIAAVTGIIALVR